MKIFLIRHGEQEYPYNEQGGVITTESAKQSIEGFRNPHREIEK